ncbi:glutamate receptor ionotropic, delta-1-like [Schistocerca nitens]|uniref:glutamate receptor ionotropic, delta-1-like n=1 Tax=Schistocerca nitens TaxID=7011 RepID=UPI002118DAF5|nr:glutamate receptor ionotropic, delta-1-like [Schistocerca nitens]
MSQLPKPPPGSKPASTVWLLRVLAATTLPSSIRDCSPTYVSPPTGSGNSTCGVVPPAWAADLSQGGGGGLSDAEASRMLVALCHKVLCGYVVFVLARRDLATELKARRLLQDLDIPYMAVLAESTRLGRERSVIHTQPVFVAVASSGVTVAPESVRPLGEVWLMMTPPAFASSVPAPFHSLVLQEPPFAIYEDRTRASGFFGGLWHILETRMNFRYSVYIRALPSLSTDLASFLVPFSARLWLAIGATVVCSALMLTLNCRLRHHHCRCSLTDAFMAVYGIICAQGAHETACTGSAGRLVLLGVLMVATTAPAAYSAVLVSLAVRYPDLPFYDLPGLLRHGGYAVGVLRNSTEHSFFSTTSDPTMQQVYNRLMEPDPDNFPATDTKAFQRVCEKKFAYFIPQEYTYAIMDNISCNVVPLPTTHFHLSLTIALAKDSPYNMLFNHNIQVLRRNGIIQKLYREWWPRREYEQDDHWEAVDMDQLMSPFGILLIGILVASLIGAVEICWHLKRKRSSTNPAKYRLFLQMTNRKV